MGQQQLLLIVVGLVVVGLMIYAGMELSRSYFESSNRDQLITTLNDLGTMAQQYYRKPVEMGGGGGSYLGWKLPAQLKNTNAGKLKASVNAKRVNFTATGTEIGMDSKTSINITCRVDQNGIRMTIKN